MMTDFKIKHEHIIISLMLIILVLAVYWNVQYYEFVNYDDSLYVYDNYIIRSGINIENLIYAVTDIHTGHWHPLSILSHMLDWQLFGGNAGGHHWTSVIIHILNTILLFIFFRYATGAIWKSAFLAALFAIHPINVESVAWIAERKNVLSTFFWILTMLFYIWYVQTPSWKRYLSVFFCFALGLMSKSMLVTLPFVLLLLDYWPLNRIGINFQNEDQYETTSIIAEKSRISFLVLEKIPLLFLTIISICLTFYAAQSVNAVASVDFIPLTARISNAIFSYAVYIRKLFWPFDLAVFYPHTHIPIWQVSIAALLLAAITILAIRYYRKYPYLVVGWFWYLGTLVPVIGFIQVGDQSMADRYAYVSFIGLFTIIAWGVSQNLFKTKYARMITALACILIIIMLSITTYNQVKVWNNTATLFKGALKSTPNNYLAYNMLGLDAVDKGDNELALSYYNAALKISPDFDQAYNNTGLVLVKMGRRYEALKYFKKAIQINKFSAEAYYNLGLFLMQENNFDRATSYFSKAIEIKKNSGSGLLVNAHINLGIIFTKSGDTKKALEHFQEALRYNPHSAAAKRNYDIVRAMQEKKLD
ncbi:MAG: tetratricopeptide repeat protein [Smithellaceae bacterium]|jgi:tetratricopeptide (TPR) repeat protein